MPGIRDRFARLAFTAVILTNDGSIRQFTMAPSNNGPKKGIYKKIMQNFHGEIIHLYTSIYNTSVLNVKLDYYLPSFLTTIVEEKAVIV